MIAKINGHLFVPQTAKVSPASTTQTTQQQESSSLSFADVLGQKQASLSGLKMSAHAQQRLQSRNIQLSATDMDRIAEAVEKASAKGARDTLVVMRDMALVVSAQNRTIITAMDGANMRENVFTQIDSAVVL